ncbi:hypothetical protein KQI42_04685 [Tissierella sp. MSJ-40]|uniref:Uncharacterized protein n=1 Tax=Tissierella simiarum TaxID=2841534 RepID=A0ABS6E3D9_9FIRM|nr:hypothetical protein [Tissierella simiarum]MBU5437292.1 hypothetical protein [Tissierella simiarum]
MKKATRILLLLMVCVMLFGSTLTVHAADCCHKPNVRTRYERANPGTWIIEYCTTCKAIYSRKWVPQEID